MLGLALGLLFLVPATAACLYYLVATLAGLFPKRLTVWSGPVHTFAVVIPAHDEEACLPAALRSVAALDYPADKVRVYVVADNCTDRTAAVAREDGAVCVERVDGVRCGKGFAVALGIAEAVKGNPDAVLVLDADCELNPGALWAFDAALTTAAAVQSSVVSWNADDGPSGYVAAVGAAVDDALAAGLDRLGRSVPLRGTGMAFRRDVLGRVRWDTASPVEDAEYDGQLRAAGVRVRFCRDAVVSTAAPARVTDLFRQRRRWTAAARPGSWFGSKPLVLAHLLVTLAVCAATGTFVWWAAGPAAVTAGVYLRAAARVGLTRRTVRSLLLSPGVVLWLVGVTLAGMVRAAPTTWDRTPRLGERQAA
jgi:GT2 family glycosyltransferase